MQKKIYTATTLTCTLQQDPEINPDKCLTGVISRLTDGFLFEETVRKGRHRRNPKLFEGKFVSLVHMQNGRYQVHMRTIDASNAKNRNELAFNVYSELLNAFEILN